MRGTVAKRLRKRLISHRPVYRGASRRQVLNAVKAAWNKLSHRAKKAARNLA